MKLDRNLMPVAALLAILAVGCGGSGSPARPVSAPVTPVSNVRLMAAELRGTDDAPKVGKPQYGAAPSEVQADESKRYDEPRRRPDRRPGGGFSGYK